MILADDYWAVHDRLKESGWIRANYRTEMGVRSANEVTCSFFDPDRHRLQLTAWREPWDVEPVMRGKITAGRIDDFPEGSVTFVKAGDFFIVRTPSGLLALADICTHLHCKLTYQKEHYQFYCYCHGRRFTREGQQVAITTDVPPLRAYPIELVDGAVVVDTDTIIRTEADADQMVSVPVPARS